MSRLRLFFFFTVSVFVCGLFYVAVLGENAKIAQNVRNFFEYIQEGRYQDACEKYGTKELCQNGLEGQSQRIDLFALELALLKHYQLLADEKYKVEVVRERMWFPFSRKDIVVGIKLKGTSSGLMDYFFGDDSGFIKNLMLIRRMDGLWKISSIDKDNKQISTEYQEVLHRRNFTKYIINSDQFLILQDLKIDKKTVSDTELKIVLSVLRKFEGSVLDIDIQKDMKMSNTGNDR